jgi:hypothetical protein
MLEHHTNREPQCGQIFTAANANSIDPDVARLKWLQAIDASQERALPGATRTANNDALAFVDA